jgi:hypothetical protein
MTNAENGTTQKRYLGYVLIAVLLACAHVVRTVRQTTNTNSTNKLVPSAEGTTTTKTFADFSDVSVVHDHHDEMHHEEESDSSNGTAVEMRTTAENFSDVSSVHDHRDQQQNEGKPSLSRERAVVMRTIAPIRPPVLERIYNLAVEMHAHQSNYTFWILVDETNDNGTKSLLDRYFQAHGRKEILPPRIFAVSEAGLLEHYPRLISYVNNAPEPNSHNSSGVCCGGTLMWQCSVPNQGIFMNATRNYEYFWSFEDDISTVGQHTLFELIRIWDNQLATQVGSTEQEGEDDSIVDLLSVMLKGNYWGAFIHTQNYEKITSAMTEAGVTLALYSDSIQRYSWRMADPIVEEISNNVMQFGERLIHPIAWKHNRTIVDLEILTQQDRTIFGLTTISGHGKQSKSQGVETLLKSMEAKGFSGEPATLVYHEELPAQRRRLLRWRRLLDRHKTLLGSVGTAK